MGVVVDTQGRIWLQCEDPNCPDLEYPEDLHSHQILVGMPLKDVKEAAESELRRRSGVDSR
jgi:hypothetical protein